MHDEIIGVQVRDRDVVQQDRDIATQVDQGISTLLLESGKLPAIQLRLGESGIQRHGVEMVQLESVCSGVKVGDDVVTVAELETIIKIEHEGVAVAAARQGVA